MARRSTISQSAHISVSITRAATRKKRLVYIAQANRPYAYTYGRSAIVYIGTTEKGANRIAESAANKARELLSDHGITSLNFFVVSCTPIQRVKTWKKLERALILTFRALYGEPPIGNTQGKKYRWGDEKDYFKVASLENTIEFYKDPITE